MAVSDSVAVANDALAAMNESMEAANDAFEDARIGSQQVVKELVFDPAWAGPRKTKSSVRGFNRGAGRAELSLFLE